MTLLGSTTLDGVWDTVLQKFVTAAYRPSMSDFGGENKSDDLLYPPDPNSNVTAANWLMLARTTIAMARAVPALVVNIGYNSDLIPYIIGFRSTNSILTFSNLAAPSGISAPVLMATKTDNGTVSITWPTGALPASVTGASVSYQGNLSTRLAPPVASVMAYNYPADATRTGISVSTRVGSTLTSIPFSVAIDGELS